MATPVLHSQARGIHPAGFLRNTAPDIAALALQDGVLWFDTSIADPLLVYVVRAGAWALLCSIGTGLDTTGHLSTACITFPNGASVCNPSADLVTLQMPTGEHQWDSTGYTLPGGHRLEVVPS